MGDRTLKNFVTICFCIMAVVASVFWHFSDSKADRKEDREAGETAAESSAEEEQHAAIQDEEEEYSGLMDETMAPLPEEALEGEYYEGIEFAGKESLRLLKKEKVPLAELKEAAMLYLVRHDYADVTKLTIQKDTVACYEKSITFECEMDNEEVLLIMYSKARNTFAFGIVKEGV